MSGVFVRPAVWRPGTGYSSIVVPVNGRDSRRAKTSIYDYARVICRVTRYSTTQYRWQSLYHVTIRKTEFFRATNNIIANNILAFYGRY